MCGAYFGPNRARLDWPKCQSPTACLPNPSQAKRDSSPGSSGVRPSKLACLEGKPPQTGGFPLVFLQKQGEKPKTQFSATRRHPPKGATGRFADWPGFPYAVLHRRLCALHRLQFMISLDALPLGSRTPADFHKNKGHYVVLGGEAANEKLSLLGA